jgi:NAD(P)-dependent dehydrogenase (short-subunit alcohol dehydrogenase family)
VSKPSSAATTSSGPVDLSHVRGIVAGGASGIGREIVSMFARCGAEVFLLDVNAYAARQAADEETAGGGRVRAQAVDVRDAGELRDAVRAAAGDGRINTLVNCVGVNRFQDPADVTETDWNDLIAVNLTGAWNLAAATIPDLKASGDGCAIFISSVAGILGIPKAVPYAAAKHGIVGLVRSLAIDLGPDGVRVNAICPGVIRTPLLDRATTDTFKQQATERTPLRRLGSTADVAAAVCFLASRHARWISGAVLPVDGGLTCGIRSSHWE